MQKAVFNDLGMGVLNNAWDGFNSTLFAYGQTGSGKSWSVVGYGVNKGMLIICIKCDINWFDDNIKIYYDDQTDLISPLNCAGIVPQFCERIFNQIEEKKKSGEQAEYEVRRLKSLLYYNIY